MARTVLIVDDDENIGIALRYLMEGQGHDVRIVAPPDLILLDVDMPKCGGYDVCQTLRSNPAWQDIKIIMLSAKGRDIDVEKGMALGADAYLTKPFSTRDLTAKVRALLESSEGDNG